MKHLERLKKLMNLAVDLEWIEKNPFSRFKLKFIKHEKAFLTKEELDQLKSAHITEPGYEKVKDVFVFACYTGLSYIDIKLLTESNFVKGIDGDYWLFTQRSKNEQPVKVPLLNEALDILNKYKDYQDKNDGLILPVLSNQKVNLYLKEIIKKLRISKKITFHSARHTFATTVTLANGVPLETVSKLLGHTKLSTTQIYARVLEQKVSKDILKLKNKLKQEDTDTILKVCD